VSKTVDFNVNANEIYNVFDKVKQKSKAMFDNEVEQAQKYSKNLKEQLKLLEEKARLLDKSARGSSNNITNFTDTFHSTKQSKLSSIDNELAEIKQSRASLKESLRKKEITGAQFIRDRDELGIEEKGLIGQRKSISGSSARNTDEYKSLKEIEKASKLTASSFRENIDLTRTSGKDLAKAIVIGDKDVADEIRESAPSRTLTEQLAQSEIEDKKKREGSGEKEKGGGVGSLVSQIMSFQGLSRLIGTVSSFSNTKNGFDQIANVRKTEGEVGGAVVGTIIGSILEGPVGAGIFADMFSNIAGQIMGTSGKLEQQGKIGTQQLEKSYYTRKALTGQDYTVGSRSDVGLNPMEVLSLQMGTARSMGTSKDVERQTDLSVFYEKGFGVQQSTSQTLEELLRSSKEGDKDIGNLLGGILKEGQGSLFKNGDRTFLNEFLQKNYTTLQRELLRGQNSPSSGTTADILMKFNSLGGPFAAKDSRSMGLISQIDNSLINSSDEVSKQRNLQVLRRLHPNFNIEQLKEEMDKGIGADGYFQGVMDDVRSTGGPRSSQILNLSGRTGIKAFEARQLLEGGVSFKNLSQKYLKTDKTDGFLKENASSLTNEMDRSAAKIEESLIQGGWKAAQKIYDEITRALDGATVTVVGDKFVINSNTNIKENLTRSSNGVDILKTPKRVIVSYKDANDEMNNRMYTERPSWAK